MKEKLITTKEAATICGYGNSFSFMRAVRNYGIPHIRFNARRIMFDPDALQDWLDRRTLSRPRIHVEGVHR